MKNFSMTLSSWKIHKNCFANWRAFLLADDIWVCKINIHQVIRIDSINKFYNFITSYKIHKINVDTKKNSHKSILNINLRASDSYAFQWTSLHTIKKTLPMHTTYKTRAHIERGIWMIIVEN